ncbi:MAG: acyl-CoA dehydrogenase family protein [Gammaproteobacteria bacterium]|nr:acyl-CoA dehydrogenase family protein [Gammaproteobacteria bacterium]
MNTLDQTEEQAAFLRSAKEFAEQSLKPFAAQWDEEAIFPVDTLKAAADMGFMSLYTPESAGGLGLSREDSALIFAELSKGCTSTAAYMTIHNMVAWMIGNWATEQARDQYLPSALTGDTLCSYCLTEPGAGSDAGNLQTKAEKVDGGYKLNGSKVFISGAGSTHTLVVMARTGGAGPKGVSALIVEANSDGIRYGKKEDKMGWNSQPTRQIHFDDVFVPDQNLMANEGDGFTLAMKALDGGRINIASCSLGTAYAAYEAALAYVKDRKQFGKAIAEFQNTQFVLADMFTELEVCKNMLISAARHLDAAHPDATLQCAAAKRFITDHCYDVVDKALQLHGGYGYIKEYPIERHLRDLRVHRILEGTNEIMRSIVARRILAD